MKKILFVAILFLNSVALSQPLNGSYSLGGTNADFATISEAVTALENNGISGAVTFNLRSGVYEENSGADRALFMENNISGTTDAQRITFQPDAGSGASRDDVILRRSSGDYELGKGYVVEIRCDYVTLRHLTIENADTVGYAGDFSCLGITSINGINLVDDVTIEGCRIYSTGVRLKTGIAVFGSGSNINISQNEIELVNWGISVYGSFGIYSGLVIADNHITRLAYIYLTSIYGTAIEIRNGTNAIVRGNHIDYTDGWGIQGISISGSSDGALVADNLITAGRGWGYPCNTFDAIVLSYGASNVRVVNNMIGGIRAGGGRGIVVSSSDNEIVYNTITHSYGSASGGCTPTAVTINALGNTIKNNIFVQQKSLPMPGYVMHVVDTTGNVFDYNVIYQSQDTQRLIYANGQLYDSLEAWQAEGHDQHSVNKLPQFVDETYDLHLAGCSIVDPELAGTPLDGLSFDYDGDLRDLQSPFMGADEADGVLPAAFSLPESYVNGSDALHFVSADLDGDNDSDIAVTNIANGDDDISIFWNDGDGNLSAPNHISFGDNPGLVGAKDIDGDNAVDLIATTGAADPVTTIRWANGGGSFAAETELEFYKPVEGFLMADMRNYGYQDIVQTHLGTVGVEAGDLSVMLNGGGNGRGFLRANMGPYSPGEHPSAAVAAKLNDDEYPDLALVDYINNSVSILINRGADGILWNGLEQGVAYTVFAGSSPLHANISAADIDGDQKVDLLVGGEWGIGLDTLALLRNQGDGTFAAVEKIPLDSRNRSETFTILDYDKDGDQDFVTANVTRNLSLYLNDGFGSFDKFLLCQNSELGGEPLTILADDFNADSNRDVAVLTIADDIVLLLNQEWTPTGIAPHADQVEIPARFTLHQNYPNPFNPSTTIEFELPAASVVTLAIYDILGRHVQTPYRASHSAGNHKYTWNATDAAGNRLAAGLYFYRLTTDQHSQTRKMLFIK